MENQKKSPRKGAENLIPIAQRSSEELREMRKKGGIKSGESRRNAKTLKEAWKVIASGKPIDGYEGENPRIQAILAMLKQACDGNPNAFDKLMKLEGVEDNLNVNVNSVPEGLNAYYKEMGIVDDDKYI